MARFPDGWVFIPHVRGPSLEDGQLVVTVSVDEKELVMCKHCKHGRPCKGYTRPYIACMKKDQFSEDRYNPEDWFCADGEKEDEHEDREADDE